MTKKILITVLVSAILSLCCGFCFASSTEGHNVNLGNEISSSLNKGADSVGNVAEDLVGAGEQAVNGVGDAFRNMDNNNNYNNNNDNNNNNGTWNNDNRTTTDGYSTMRTTAEGTQATNGTMSTTTWMWIIFAIAAVIIIAAIWYYAMQGNDRS